MSSKRRSCFRLSRPGFQFRHLHPDLPSILPDDSQGLGRIGAADRAVLSAYSKHLLPLARPAIIIVFLFSFVWTWNETFVTGLYAGGAITLPLKLMAFANSYAALFPPGTPGAELNEAIKLAGNVLTVLPLLVIYFIFQKWFTESIDRTGITGE